jgi:bla regulator protein blaR1
MHILPDTILRAICWSLLHSLWQGFVLAAVAGTVMVLTKKASSALRYNLLCSLMFLFLLVSGYTFYRQLQVPVPGTSYHQLRQPVSPTVYHQPQQLLTIQRPLTQPLQQGIDTLVKYFNTHASLIVLIWFILFLAKFVQLLSGIVYAQRIRHYKTHPAPFDWQERLRALIVRLGITRSVSLLQSGMAKTPLVIGFLKPVILLPVGMLTHLAPEQVESILLHELAHIRRRDYLFNVVQHVVDTLFFFNPALIWISSLIRNERENCCDDIAIRETRSRRRLIEALVSFHQYERSAAGFALSFAEKESQVVKRVRRIVDRKNSSIHAGERALLMGGLLILSAAFITIRGSRSEPLPHPAKTRSSVASASPAQKQDRAAPIHNNPAGGVAYVPQVTNPPLVKVTNPPLVQVTTPAVQPDTVPDLFRNAGVDKWIECKDHGVTPEFVAALQKMGYRNFTLDKAIELKDHGVDLAYLNGFASLGFANIPLDKAVELKDHGVRLEYVTQLKDLGFPNVQLEKLVDLVDHGVTIEYITGMKKRMGTRLELGDYIRLRDAGIDPSEQQ